jgi:hypothetical protein
MEVIYLPLCGSLSHKRISFEDGDIGSLILGEMRPFSSFIEKFSDRVLVRAKGTRLSVSGR